MEKKCALITGGRRGIGFGIALELAKHNYRVIITGKTDASSAKAEIEKAGGECLAYSADISKKEDRLELFNKISTAVPRLDVLVNNAGIAPKVRADILEATEESFDELISVNLKGPYFLTQLFAGRMIEQKKKEKDYNPVIINISSVSSFASSANRGDYCVSKAGISMMTKLYADRLSEFGIPVFEIQPGIIATDMTSGVKAKYDKMIKDGVFPIKRWGVPEDIARTVLAIAGGCLPYSTGQVLHVDGGFHLRRL